MVRVCNWGDCLESSRDSQLDKSKPKLKFVNFPSPINEPERVIDWIRLCGWKESRLRDVKNAHVCQKHFPVGANLNHRVNRGLKPIPFDADHEKKYQQMKKRAEKVEKEENFTLQKPMKTYARKRKSETLVAVPVPKSSKVLVGTPSKIDLLNDSKSTPIKITTPKNPKLDFKTPEKYVPEKCDTPPPKAKKQAEKKKKKVHFVHFNTTIF